MRRSPEAALWAKSRISTRVWIGAMSRFTRKRKASRTPTVMPSPGPMISPTAITRAVSGRHVFGSEQPDVVIIDEAIKGFGSLVEAVARDAIHPGIVVLVEASGVQLVKELQSLSGALRMVDKSQYRETTIAEAFKQVLEARAAG